MRVVVLSACDPTGNYLADRLRGEGRLDRLIRVTWTGAPPKPPRRRKWSMGRVLSAVDRRLQGRYLEWRFTRLRDDTALALQGRMAQQVEPDEVVEAHELNTEAFAERLRELAPDVMVVNGAPILRPLIYGIPRHGTMNVHFGVAPQYRGSFTLFWALYHDEPEHVGATVHFMDAGVDTGPVVGYAYPELAPGISEGEIMARCAVGATDIVVAALARLSANEPLGVVPVEARDGARPGRSFKKLERRLRHDVSLWLRSRLGLSPRRRSPARLVVLA